MSAATPAAVPATPTTPTSPTTPPAKAAAPAPRPRPWWRKVLSFLLDQWLLIAMGLVILLAYFFPSVGKRGGHIAAQWTVTWGAVVVIFLVSGLALPFDKLLYHAKNLRLHLIVQVMSFLLTSAVFFGVCVAAHTNSNISAPTLVGLVATGCLPTTIASNVVMTRAAGGDEAATMVSVTIGNFLGPFITPLLLTKLYLPAVPAFKPYLPAEATHHLPQLYRTVMKQMGLTVFVPLFVGQIIRWFWPKQTSWVLQTFKLAKAGSLCLVALVWSTFCTAFAAGALKTINTPTIVFNIFINIVLCVSFTALSFYLCRPPAALTRLSPFIFKQINKKETISILFCAPAKTQALGIPLISAMYTTSTDMTRALIQVPMILYTVEQILVGQVLIAMCQRWLAQDKVPDAEAPTPDDRTIATTESKEADSDPATESKDADAASVRGSAASAADVPPRHIA
ncbi:LRR receptor-like serine/threonine-protein kinase RGI2 [Vanrija albida]|uniref:LRR receptor-like serine/threonine-protein kinase RGI2 n=1 Tax=Vanrija albida TaxID=181172 RepID=A0ABR3Q6M1_9TREE